MQTNIDQPLYDALEMFRGYFNNDYLYAIFIFLLFLFTAYLITFVYRNIFKIICSKTETKIDDRIIESAKNPVIYFILLIGVKAIISVLHLEGTVIDIFLNVINSILVIIFAYLLILSFDIMVDEWGRNWQKKTKSKYGDTILPFVHRIIFILFVICALIVVLGVWGIQIAPFLAGLGILGLAIGLAVQDSLKDLVGGINLILDSTYKVGDKVKIDSGETGEIYAISIRSTRIRTYSNNVIIIPNHLMAASKIINYAQPKSKERGEIPFGVIYGSDIEKTKQIALEAVRSVPAILEDPAPSIEFLELADYSLNFRALFWIKSFSEKWDTERQVVQRLYDSLNKAGIEFAFPTRTIFLENEKKKD